MIVVSRNSADIWVVNADGTGQRRLTFAPNHQENDPAYSPGGIRIVYTLNEFGEPGNGTCIYVMNAPGTAQWNLVRRRTMSDRMGGSYAHNVVIHYASWSPNGRRIAFRGDGVCTADGSTTGGLNIWTMNPAGVWRGTSQQAKT